MEDDDDNEAGGFGDNADEIQDDDTVIFVVFKLPFAIEKIDGKFSFTKSKVF